MAEDAPPALIALDDVDESALVRIDGTDPTRVVAEVRDAVAAGHTVVVTPDAAADDRDAWIALVSVAVVEGALSMTDLARRPGP